MRKQLVDLHTGGVLAAEQDVAELQPSSDSMTPTETSQPSTKDDSAQIS